MKKPQTPKIAPAWASVAMSPEAQTFYESTFLPNYEKLLNNISKIPLAVLVWGPRVGWAICTRSAYKFAGVARVRLSRSFQ